MEEPKSLINIGDLAAPATTLIEKIADAIGGVFRPQQIRKVAMAEADAEVIRARAEIEVSDIKRRALERFVEEEAKKQANMESIADKALLQLDNEASPENMEDDWITNFFDKSRLISNDEMQVLWSRLLAGEANKPGKFSKRTIDVLASLDKSDAETFSKLCSFAVGLGDLVPLIYDVEANIYTQNGISFNSVIHLENLGLVHHEGVAEYVRKGLNEYGYVPYFDKRLYIRFSVPSPELNLGKVLFTQIGQQLAEIVSAVPVEGFDTYLKEKWVQLGYKVEPEEAQSAEM